MKWFTFEPEFALSPLPEGAANLWRAFPNGHKIGQEFSGAGAVGDMQTRKGLNFGLTGAPHSILVRY